MTAERLGSWRIFPALTSVFLLFVALAAPLFTPGCDAPEGSVPTVQVAVVPKGTTHDFWRMIHAGAIKAEREVNRNGKYRIETIWKGPYKEDDTTDQVTIVRTFLNRTAIKGMVLAPLDRTALTQSVAEWKGRKKPVVIIDSGLEGESGKDFATYVATDNYKGGVLAAQRLGEILGEKGNVILLRYQIGSESTEQREKGFTETLAKSFPAIKLVSDNQYAGATEKDALDKSQSLLNRFKGDVDGIFCPNESSVAGMLGALEQSSLAGTIKFIGFDASEKLVTGMREGKIHGLVLQNPIKMGYEGVMALVKALDGETLPPYIDTGVVVATPDNMNEPAMVALHSPDLSEWLGE